MNDNEILLRKKKTVILIMGIALMFFTSMSKMLVPGPIYNQLMQELLFSPAQIALLGSVYMYSYASSQLLAGIFSSRYGGVRILLIGGSLFTAGMVIFPCSSSLWLMALARIISGFGAGTVFLGVTKLLSDLFSEKFAMILGIILFISYLGPVTGTVPMVWLIASTSWRSALLTPGVICLFLMAGIFGSMKGTIVPAKSGQTFAPLIRQLKNGPMWLLCLASGLIFGIYYVLLTQIGQKCIEDFYGISKYTASSCITMLALVVAANNILVNFLLKLAGGRVKLLLVTGCVCAVTGTGLGCCVIRLHLPFFWMVAAFLLIAIPAGFFSFYSLIAKNLNLPEDTAFAVAILNCWAYIFIALWGNISGTIFNVFQKEMQNGIFSASAYFALFVFLTVSAVLAVVLAVMIPNGRCTQKS